MRDLNVLLVERRESAAEQTEKRLKDLGYAVCATAFSESQAVARALETRPQVVLVGLAVEDGFDGIEVARQMRQLDIPVLLLTDGAESELLQRAAAAEPFGYVLRPIEERQLRLSISSALHLHRGRTRDFERARRLSSILDHVEAAVIAIDADGAVTFMNPLAESLLEWRHAELIGVLLPEVFQVRPDESADGGPSDLSAEGVVSNVLRWGARVSGSSAALRTKTGQEIEVSYHAAPLRDSKRNCTGAVVVVRPGTKAQEAEQELKRTLTRLQSRLSLMETVFESLGDGVAVANRHGHLLVSNTAAGRMVGGVTADGKELGKWPEIYGIYYPDEETPVPPHELAIVRAIGGEPTDGAEVFIRNASTPKGIHVSVSGRPLQADIDGSGSVGVIVMRDITARRAAEKKLHETVDKLSHQTQLMRATFNAMSDGVVVADEEGRFTLFNPAAKRIIGKGLTDTNPDQWTAEYGIFCHDRSTPVATEELPLVRAVRGEAVDEMEMFIRNAHRPEGVNLSVSGRPIVTGGVRRGGVIVFRDVTDKVRSEEALANAFAQGRLEILDTILHNVGNAINSVAVGVETLQGQLSKDRLLQRFSDLSEVVKVHAEDWDDFIKHDPQGRQVRPFLLAFADGLEKRNQRLLRTVDRVSRQTNHIVDIIRTQQALGDHVARKDVNLRQAVTSAMGILQDAFRRKGIRTRVNFGNAPEEIRIQESQFHQMLVNLFKNAMEATDELRRCDGLKGPPRIELRAYVRQGFLVLDVIDNGIGIPKKRLRGIFAASYTTKPQGSGLGLHSAANFVTSSGGRIQPLSDGVGQGTTMRVMLRLVDVGSGQEARTIAKTAVQPDQGP